MTLPDGAEYWWDIKGWDYSSKYRVRKKRKFNITRSNGVTEKEVPRMRAITILKEEILRQIGMKVPRSTFKGKPYALIIELLKKYGCSVEVAINRE